MTAGKPHPGSIIPFIRRRDYKLIRTLGRGACGETVLLQDDLIDSYFVCKKYSPFEESLRPELFKNFVREIKLLHELHHQNVVRVFNYYVYPDKFTGYILMEYIEGSDIEEHLRANPETINNIFLQIIDGFAYLESCQILHRDIRPQNILVRADGVLKIIDLGFGKRIEASKDFDKSISLNWWCDLPLEFANGIYDHSTEIYFVAKLFQNLINEIGIKQFKHSALVERMCSKDRRSRIKSFLDVRNDLILHRSEDIEFDGHELDAYRNFADAVSGHVTQIQEGVKYAIDLDVIRAQLETAHRNCMLEDFLPDCAPVLRALLAGQYYYRKANFETRVLHDFINFLRNAPLEKQRIALANLHARLDAVKRYTVNFDDDDIPF